MLINRDAGNKLRFSINAIGGNLYGCGVEGEIDGTAGLPLPKKEEFRALKIALLNRKQCRAGLEKVGQGKAKSQKRRD